MSSRLIPLLLLLFFTSLIVTIQADETSVEQQVVVSYIKIDTPTTSLESGSQLTGTVTAYDSNGNVAPLSGYSISIGAASSGATVQGTTRSTLQNGVANFAISITTSITSDVMLSAVLVYGSSYYSFTKNLRVNNRQGENKDFTEYWVGQWSVQPGCNPSTCCCMDGQVTATRSGLNLVQLESNVKGMCGGVTSTTFYVGNINSYYTIYGTVGADPFTLQKTGKTIQMTNMANNACSGSAICTTACPRSNASTLRISKMVVMIIVLVSFLVMVL
ncbi:hypothetical protein C9374_013083 [Naegleria lovaniensis]|uniref:Big-1 domain-containing protein n=1 Tax=Naegleria lovaniensis TaxID=51637 RepID=A0AA88KE25_NAELO|nr:uncharacterized protein C9374_013083 [Naegleria lovaniensis]KAG2372876.1 hypothetical protein C9374_013083 [Naegleria lovaniensis]